MLRHIVMVKFKDSIEISVASKKLKAMLENLEHSIDSLVNIEAGINMSTKPSAHDIVLTADFEDIRGLDSYRVHPEHIKVLDYLKEVMEKVAVVDYVI